MQYTSIKDMINYMNAGKPFSLVYITYDSKTGRGGAVKKVQQAVKTFVNDSTINAEIKKDNNSVIYATKNPNHFANGTINIRVTAAGNADIRKVHVQLIRRFNGQIVK